LYTDFENKMVLPLIVDRSTNVIISVLHQNELIENVVGDRNYFALFKPLKNPIRL